MAAPLRRTNRKRKRKLRTRGKVNRRARRTKGTTPSVDRLLDQ